MWNVPTLPWFLKYTLVEMSDVDKAFHHKIEPCSDVKDAENT
tara:strand:- start:3452 stop:3577 length:126 start_codon:yes stop_codon:yes gene_type:complete